MLVVIVNEGFVAHSKTTLGLRVQPIGDGRQRVALAQLEERLRATAVLGRHSTLSTDTAWIESARFERQDLLDVHVVLPTVNEVIFVQEALMESEPEIGEMHAARVDEAFGAMLTSVNHEAIKMLVAPAEGDLQRSKQVGNGAVATSE